MDNNIISNFITETLAPLIRINQRDIFAEARLDSFPTWDSLSALQLLMAIEKKYDVKIDPAQLFVCESVNDLVKFVEGLSS